MPIYLYWGSDDYRLQQAAQDLEKQVLDSTWRSFNYDKIDLSSGGDANDRAITGLNQAMTPPFGLGNRLVWLVDPPLGRSDAAEFNRELERTLPALPHTTHLLLTLSSKPDGRSKLVKMLQAQADVQEFSPIPPWKTDLLEKAAHKAAQQIGVSLTPEALNLLAEAVSNDTRQLYTELEKLKLYASDATQPLDAHVVAQLTTATHQSSLQLADALRRGHTSEALQLTSELLRQNEPGLKIVATLVKQFRTWLWLKLLLEAGERDERTLATAAEVGNPKRIYFLRQEVQALTSRQLRQALHHLLDLEVRLKQGGEVTTTLHTQVIKLCATCQSRS
ncbi:DNA polymerase III subunit delta [Synechococcales cyanobacterium C]|uniref:DNA polymerase III subunit delta n=1 Tax=Petrachloros mirabilis ULC683 TaxID=2781853 RepID=A0A8K2A8I2_9CYAN|nr:DNA polymerase III subunit delta [Petrachloros mirabilis]NCJ07135.1 DNA polymerase III subunit delta [Petrachloros mirabilis ULC683]